MKKFVVLNRILILGAVVFLSGCSLRKNVVPNPKPPVWEENAKMPWTEEENEVRLVQITDPHFYSPSLTDGGERYQKIMENAAGRAALDVEKILESFAKEMKELKPDVLVVSGDMTLNGEKESHREFAAYLEEFERNGIQVLVIPGNHDINNPYARTIRDKEVAKAESITGEDFEAIYRDFGYAEALERDEDSLSYVAEVSENLWVLMLDTCIYRDSHQDTGSLSYHTKKWALNVAEKAGKQGKKLISVTHHNLLGHNAYFTETYTIANSQRFAEELSAAGVQLNLSGHMHITHQAEKEEGIYDIALESLAVWPNPYGQLDISRDGAMYYSTRQVKYPGNAYRYLYQTNWKRNYERLEEYGLSEEKRKVMADFIAELNADYFSGRMRERAVYETMPGYALWRQMPEDDFHTVYIEEMLKSSVVDHTNLLIPGNR